MDFAGLSLTSIKICSPVVVFIVYVIVSGVSLYMSRNILKRYNNQKMENLYDLYSWSEVKLVIVLGVVIYGLCQYDQMNLAWLFLLLPIIYIMLKNILVYYNVSIAHHNAPKDPDVLVKEVIAPPSSPSPGASVYPTPPTVKKEVNTNIFGMRGDPVVEGVQNTPPSINHPTEEPFSGPKNPPGGPKNEPTNTNSMQSSIIEEIIPSAGGSWVDQFNELR